MKKLFFIFFIFVGVIQASIPVEIIENVKCLFEKTNNRFIIAVAGCPGVGKSMFAENLADELSKKEIKSKIISFDHFGKTNQEKKD